MDAVEFLRDFRRMCWTYEEPCCENCKLEGGGCNFTDWGCNHEKAVRIVEKWAKEHPVKTRLSEFLLLFPNESVQEGGCPSLCTKFFDSTVSCKDSEGCLDCKKKFWLTPIEEEEKMINLFISMPMRGKTHKEIINTRYRAIARVKSRFPHEDITVINPLPFTSGERPLPVCCLADSLKRMTTADVIFFAKDWDIARGCRVEQFVACHYMPQILRMYESKQRSRKKEPFQCLTL